MYIYCIYLFIYAFIYNSITKSYWQKFCQTRLEKPLMVKVLTCRVEGPGFESHHGKTFQKKMFWKKVSKNKSQLSSACMMEVQMMGVLSNL